MSEASRYLSLKYFFLNCRYLLKGGNCGSYYLSFDMIMWAEWTTIKNIYFQFIAPV